MPSITAPSKVLVTGANGFIATHIVKVLLETGYFVRGTVRDYTKGDYLKKLFNDDKFDYVVINDIAKPGAFDDAIKDVDAALHTAASLKPELGDPANLINDVVFSTTGILESAKQVGSNVQRVIFTGTTASVYQPPQGKYIFTEKDWNEAAPKAVEQQGAAASPLVKYAAAKVSAERAAWEWIKTNKNSVKFDIVTICPPLVYGPMIHKLEGQQDVNMSNRYFLMNLKAPRTEEQIAKKEGSYIDVRDLAKIHVDLLSKEKAANERFIASAGCHSWQDVYDALNEEPALVPGIPIGTPGATKGKVYDYRFDTSKLQSVLGVPANETYRPLAETMRDLAQQVINAGVWPTQV